MPKSSFVREGSFPVEGDAWFEQANAADEPCDRVNQKKKMGGWEQGDEYGEGAWWLIEERQWGLSMWRKLSFTLLWLWRTLCTVFEWRSPDCFYQLSQLLTVGGGGGGERGAGCPSSAWGSPMAIPSMVWLLPLCLILPGLSSLYTSHGGSFLFLREQVSSWGESWGPTRFSPPMRAGLCMLDKHHVTSLENS